MVMALLVEHHAVDMAVSLENVVCIPSQEAEWSCGEDLPFRR